MGLDFKGSSAPSKNPAQISKGASRKMGGGGLFIEAGIASIGSGHKKR